MISARNNIFCCCVLIVRLALLAAEQSSAFGADLHQPYQAFDPPSLPQLYSANPEPKTNPFDDISVIDIFNQKINGLSEQCPRRNVIMFFMTREKEYLTPCIRPALLNSTRYEQPEDSMRDQLQGLSKLNQLRNLKEENDRLSEMGGAPSQDERESKPKLNLQGTPVSYSGRLLKRILQNMGDGTVKVDFPNANFKPIDDKRARLSINGALSSLADMLRHESGRHRKPQYAFHSDLLKMGK
ncbi:uncharacterized protein LOC128205209 isoform X2 [Mya arenaria]|nr:uncharacterized protein LOC128205209 isoform X2 [Mya arenaria]